MAQQKLHKPRFGRPPRPPDEVRSQRLVTYVTLPQLRELQLSADEQGKSLSGVVYEILSEAIGQAGRGEKK